MVYDRRGLTEGAVRDVADDGFNDIVAASLGDVDERSQHEPDASDRIRSNLAEMSRRSGNDVSRLLGNKENNTANYGRNRGIGAQERVGWGENINNSQQTKPRNKKGIGGFLSRHGKGVAGWATTLLIAGAGISIGGMVSGPAHYLQLAAWLRDTYQSLHQLQTTARQTRNLASMARTAVKSAVGGTISGNRRVNRIGVWGDYIASKYQSKLSEKGISFNSTDTGSFRGYTVEVSKAPGLRDLSTEQIAERLGVDKSRIKWRAGSKGVFDLDMSGNRWYDSRAGPGNRTILATLSETAGIGSKYKAIDALNQRTALRANGVNNAIFHPFKSMNEKFNIGTLLDYIQMKRGSANTRVSPDENKAGDDATEEQKAESEKSKKNAETLNENGESGKTKSDPKKSWSSHIGESKVGKVLSSKPAGIVGIIVMVICIMKSLSEGNGEFIRSEIVQKAMQFGGVYQGIAGAIMVGSKAVLDSTSGDATLIASDNANLLENLGELSPYMLYTSDIETVELDDEGNPIADTKSTYNVPAENSEAFQYEQYNKRVDNNTRDLGLNNIPGNDMLGPLRSVMTFLEQGIGGTITSTICGPIGQILGTAIDIVSGLGSIIMGVLIGFAAEQIMNYVMGVINGDPLRAMDANNAGQNLTTAAFGTRLWNGSQSLLDGGTTLSVNQAAHLKQIKNEALAYEYSKLPLMDKLFDPTNYRSMIATIGRDAGLNTASSSVATAALNFAKIIKTVPTWISRGLLGWSSNVSASDDDEEYYGFQEVAFTDGEMEKLINQDDFDMVINEEKVFPLLDDDSNLDKYNAYAEKCMGKTIARIGEAGSEDVDYMVSEVTTEEMPQYYLSGSPYEDCRNMRAEDENYLRIAAYAGVDYNTTRAFACYYSLASDESVSGNPCEPYDLNLSTSAAAVGDGSCAPNTIELGVYPNAHKRGEQVSVTLCELTSIKMSGGFYTTQDPEIFRKRPDGEQVTGVIVNADVSEKLQAMGEAALAGSPSVQLKGKGIRSFEKQQYFWKCYQTKKCNNGNEAARPGNSEHEGGHAIDFESGSLSWLRRHAKEYGFCATVASENWHYSPSKGKRCYHGSG